MEEFGYATDYRLPLAMRFQNGLLTLLGKGKAAVSVEALCEAACKQTGLTDFGDESALVGLDALVEAFNRGSRPSFMTRLMFVNFCKQALVKRLEVVDCLNKHPEIRDQPLRKPLFITGLPRTGTTFLQNLLAQDPRARPLLTWEQQRPCPPPKPETYDEDPRIAKARAGLAHFYKLVPIYQAVHRMEAQAPEECNGLLDPAFCSVLAATAYPVKGFFSWMLNQDMSGAYRFYKQELQLLDWCFPQGRHWVLKAPLHLNFLDALAEVFPDAAVVMTHRDPLQVLPSAASLSYLLRAVHGARLPGPEIGRLTLDRLARSMERALSVRANGRAPAVLDVSYQALIGDPLATVRSIYHHFGYPWHDDLEERLTKWVTARQQKPGPRHRYDLQRFGMDEGQIRERFAFYWGDGGALSPETRRNR